MSRIDHLTARYVETIPAQLDDGYLYISRTYNTAVHRCCCGCGNRVTTPTTATGWRLTVEDESITLSPSIGNGAFPCGSHYWVMNGKIKWLAEITPEQTAYDRAHDRAEVANAVRPPSFIDRVKHWIRKLFQR